MRFLLTAAVSLGMLAHAGSLFAQSIAEVEPNNSISTATPAVLGAQATGYVDRYYDEPEDDDSVDYWVVHVTAGDTIHVALDGCGLCVDGHFTLQLLNTDGSAPSGVQTVTMRGDPQIRYVAARTGAHFVRVTYWYMVESGSHYTLTFRERKCPDDATEPNDTPATAMVLGPGADVEGRWCPTQDRDWFAIRAGAGEILEFWWDGVVTSHYVEPKLLFYDSLGTGLDQEVQRARDGRVSSDGAESFSPRRYEVRTGGMYYLRPSSWRGALEYRYRLHVRSGGHLPPSPGDPISRRAAAAGTALAVDRQGNIWTGSSYDRLDRIAPDGTRTEYGGRGILHGLQGIGWDPYGNMLILKAAGLFRFSPPDRLDTLITTPPYIRGGFAVGSDGIWFADSRSRTATLYDLDGTLKSSIRLDHLPVVHDIDGNAEPFMVALAPDGAPHVSTGAAIYRLDTADPELVVRHEGPARIRGFAFDSEGNIYVSDDGTNEETTGLTTSRVALHSPAGAVIADPFAWWPFKPGALAFGRNPDGSATHRLFAIDLDAGSGAYLIELNSAGVAFPGLPPGYEAPCAGNPLEGHPLSHTTIVTGVACRLGRPDTYRFSAFAGQQTSISVRGAEEPILEVVSPDGSIVGDTGRTDIATLKYRADAAGDYLVRVHSAVAGPRPYTLRLEPVRPAGLTLSRAAQALTRSSGVLTPEELAYLDLLGNHDGTYDLGDFRAFFARERESP